MEAGKMLEELKEKEEKLKNELIELEHTFNLKKEQIETAKKLIKSLYKILVEKDASLIEINPLIITKKEKI